MEYIIQAMIFITGSVSIFLITRKEHWNRWGHIVGLIGQPFWVYTMYQTEQWGILVLTSFYTYSWCQGIWYYWITPYCKSKKYALWLFKYKVSKSPKCDKCNRIGYHIPNCTVVDEYSKINPTSERSSGYSFKPYDIKKPPKHRST